MAWPSSSYAPTDKLSHTIVNSISGGLAAAGGDRNGGGYNLSNNDAVYLKRLLDAGTGNPLVVFSPGYNFTPQTPGGSLTASVQATVTLAPVPRGINGTDSNHYLYVSGGTGTAEAVLITGGTAVSGAASGTVIFTPANSHSGAWTIASQAGGLPEALYSLGMAGGIVLVVDDITVHAPISIPHPSGAPGIVIQGRGQGSPALIRASNFAAGNLLQWLEPSGTNGSLTIRDLFISNGGSYGARVNNTSGSAIYLESNLALSIKIDNVRVDSGYCGLDINSSSNVLVNGFIVWNAADYAASYASLAGIRIRNTISGGYVTGIKITDSIISGGVGTSTYALTNGILIEAADGVVISGCSLGLIGMGIVFSVAANSKIVGVEIDNCFLDSFKSHAIYASGTGGVPFTATSFRVSNSHIAGRYDVNTAYDGRGLFVESNSYVKGLQILNNRFVLNGQDGIAFANTNALNGEAIIFGNEIHDNGLKSTTYSGILFGGGNNNVLISGNHIFNTVAGAGKQAYGIQIVNAALVDTVITGNNFTVVPSATAQAPVLIGSGGSLTRGVIADNGGLDDVIGSVASGATVALPLNPCVKITGTTTITTLTGGYTGRVVQLLFTDASPGGVGTGGNILRTQTVVQNQAIVLRFDGTNWY